MTLRHAMSDCGDGEDSVSGSSRPSSSMRCGAAMWQVGDAQAARAEIARGVRCVCIGHEVDVLRTAYAEAFARCRPQ